MENTDIVHPLKYTFGYIIGSVFLLGILIYVYLLIIDRNSDTTHSVEETVWIYIFLTVMIIGLSLSYYSIYCANKTSTSTHTFGKFVGIKKNIPGKKCAKKMQSIKFIP